MVYTAPEAWEVKIERGDERVSHGTHATADAALLRANALWVDHLLDGWTEP